MYVHDVMTRDVVTTSPSASLSDVADVLVGRRLRAIPVVDEAGHVLGMITDRQVMEHFLPALDDPGGRRPTRPTLLREAQVRDIMQRTVMCVNDTESLGDVVRLMLDKELERLPVTREGQLVGFLTRGDIIRRLLRDSDAIDPSEDRPEDRESTNAEHGDASNE